MTPGSRARWLWLLCAVAVLLGVTAIPLQFLTGEETNSGDAIFLTVGLLMITGYSTVGAILASRNPRNPIGAIMLVVALAFGLGFATESYATLALETHPGALPFGAAAAWFGTWVYAVTLFGLPLLGLLYPSGRVVGPRWRSVPWVVLTLAGLASLGTALAPGSMAPETAFAVDNPFGIEGLGPMLRNVGAIGWIGLFVSIPVSIASLVLRYRRSEGEARQQIRWLVFVAVAVIGFLLITLAVALLFGERFERSIGPQIAFGVIFSLIAVGVPAAIGVAILKYRLYDLDLVIKKTVQYAVLLMASLLLIAVLVLLPGVLVVGLDAQTLPGVAIGVVAAAAFMLLRVPARRIANRIVYGKRSTPYEVLSEFAERVGETYSTDDVLPRMAQLLGEATGAQQTHVWLLVGGAMRADAGWPMDVPRPRDVLAKDGDLPDFGDDDAFEVRHQGELLGALTVTPAPNDPMNPSKEKLARDMAAQAGLVLRNVRLIEDLRESRRRIVAAQDARAKKLERNIHDGAQQQLVALAVKLGLVERLVGTDPDRATTMLAEARAETSDALSDLRDLARGIYPPLLADKGLAAALEGQARKSAVPVTVEPDGIGRYSPETEAAVYFSCLEALQNVAKYANATRAIVRLAHANGDLTFEVVDDGVGFDPNGARTGSGLQGIADRLAAVGGSLEIRSEPGAGAVVGGRIPLAEAPR